MAEDSQKTEEPTQRRLDQARQRGETPMSGEVRHAFTFAAAAVVVGGLGAGAVSGLAQMAVRLWGGADDIMVDPAGSRSLVTGIFAHLALSFMPIMGLFIAAAVAGGVVQGRPGIAWGRVAPKWSKISPASGLKRMFGMRSLVEFGKTVLKFAAVVCVALAIAWPHAVAFDGLIGASPVHLVGAMREIAGGMIKVVAMLVVALAVFDIVYQRRAFIKRMRMTLQEVRDEMKDSDGDPKIKARIRAIAQERARRRMMAAVPRATVVVTNPTHYAVALEYRHGEMAAPVVVAKGVDAVALRIRDVAGKAGVPVIESPPLARALYASAEIDRVIPVEHYAAVAEIISYVLHLARQKY
jgi:flagellar biosynthetic protein FlhB